MLPASGEAGAWPSTTTAVGLAGRSSATQLGRVSWIFVARVAEPDPDRGDIDGAVVDELALVGAHGDGAERLEPVVRALGGVALLVGLGVERGRAARRQSPSPSGPSAGRSSPGWWP